MDRNFMQQDSLTNQRAKSDDATLEGTKDCAAPMVDRRLLKGIARDAEDETVVKVLGKSEIGVEFVAAVVIVGGISRVDGVADKQGSLAAGPIHPGHPHIGLEGPSIQPGADYSRGTVGAGRSIE